jgi:hypothetical protein
MKIAIPRFPAMLNDKINDKNPVECGLDHANGTASYVSICFTASRQPAIA